MKVKKQQNSLNAKIVSDSYSKASAYIKSAIEVLGQSAKDDILAQESIANLGVVLLDLNK